MKMQVALLVFCEEVGIAATGSASARAFEEMMDRARLSENNERWWAALTGYSYCEGHLRAIVNRVPAVQRLVDHPFWRVLELSVIEGQVNADTLLNRYYPDFLRVGLIKQKQWLSRCNNLECLTLCLLLVASYRCSAVHLESIARALNRLCAENIWSPARYALVGLVRCWLEYFSGFNLLPRMLSNNEELNFRMMYWQALHELCWRTPLVQNEQQWRAVCHVLENADQARQEKILQSLTQLDAAGGSIFGDATLHSLYRCRSGVLRGWGCEPDDVNLA
ncbi:hypothetical protein [Pseudomonas sp. ACN8]|uniref:hypothetical protein n=1 Tax=Pseudomonas sp. ACN8 TaxID=1920428 RepID=UPI001144F33B|nr:hypothetical protein [Pseudomonas sp. ACN8]